MEATTPPEEGRPAAINIVCVGDGATGKTTFLQNAVRTSVKSHPVFQTYQTQIILQKLAVTVNLRDTGGQEEFDKMRPSSYEGAHLVFVFYSIISPPSFQAVTTKWLPEVRRYAPSVPIILVGAKKDLRNNTDMIERLASRGMKPVTTQQGMAHQKQALAKEIKAAKFVEICHENHHELIELINDGMLVVLSKGGKRLKKDKCNLV